MNIFWAKFLETGGEKIYFTCYSDRVKINVIYTKIISIMQIVMQKYLEI